MQPPDEAIGLWPARLGDSVLDASVPLPPSAVQEAGSMGSTAWSYQMENIELFWIRPDGPARHLSNAPIPGLINFGNVPISNLTKGKTTERWRRKVTGLKGNFRLMPAGLPGKDRHPLPARVTLGTETIDHPRKGVAR